MFIELSRKYFILLPIVINLSIEPQFNFYSPFFIKINCLHSLLTYRWQLSDLNYTCLVTGGNTLCPLEIGALIGFVAFQSCGGLVYTWSYTPKGNENNTIIYPALDTGQWTRKVTVLGFSLVGVSFPICRAAPSLCEFCCSSNQYHQIW